MKRTEPVESLVRAFTGLVVRPRMCQSCARRQYAYRTRISRAALSTSARRRNTGFEVDDPIDQENGPITAAPPIDFSKMDVAGKQTGQAGVQISQEKLRKLRIIPSSPSYFTAKPISTDDLIALQAISHRWQRLPTVKQSEAPRVAWLGYDEYKAQTGHESVRRSAYGLMVSMLRRLNRIIPEMRPAEVETTIGKYSRRVDPRATQGKPILIDEFGRARAVGRRKASSAQVYLVEGDGEVMINGKTLAEAFARVHDRESAIWALKSTDRIDKYNVWALVNGGGTTGQAEALTLGIAKALMAHEPLLKRNLRKAGCVTRDRRSVERKKPGRVKARKMPTWVKR